jgi:aconitate hydratase 2 / 2-methylisocitrate dehydratase
MLEAYRQHVKERADLTIPPLPIDAEQMSALVELLKNPPAGEEEFLLDLLVNRVPPGVDDAAYVKAGFLAAVARGEAESPLVDRRRAVELLGTMLGGYNIEPLIELLDDTELGELAAEQLKFTLLMFDALHDVEDKADAGNVHAKAVMQSWADAEWFTRKPDVPQEIRLRVFKVTGETNTDDLSPAQDAWSRPDIPLHALAMLKNPREGITSAIEQILTMQAKGLPLAYVGDVVGTGSSRKSATNSVLWHMGDDIPLCRTSARAAWCWAARLRRSSSTPWRIPAPCRSSARWTLKMGDVIVVKPHRGRHRERGRRGDLRLRAQDRRDPRRGQGRRTHPADHRAHPDRQGARALGLPVSDVFRRPQDPEASGKGFTLAQKMVGRACGLPEGRASVPAPTANRAWARSAARTPPAR